MPDTAPPQGPGPLITGVQQTDVSQASDPIHPDALPAQGGMAIGAAGDTLRSIAAAVWGDASLWWLIAEANSLTGAETLIAGQVRTLPAKVSYVPPLVFAPLDLCGPRA